MACRKLDAFSVGNFIQSFDYMLADCDGVLWLSVEPIPGVSEVIKTLRDECKKKVIFISNNSTKSRAEYLKKFQSLNISANVDEIFSSAYCVAVYLKSLNFTKKVYLIGSEGISEEFKQFGIEHLPIGSDPVLNTDDLLEPVCDPEVGAVVVGFDSYFSYSKMNKALRYLRDPECLFIATNMDSQYPVTGGHFMPGTGAIVAAVAFAAEREPLVMGKPSSAMLDCLRKEHPALEPSRCLVIGDRMDTDIVMGRENGMQTLLVLTGVTQECQLQVASPNHLPDYYLPSLGDLNSLLRQ